MEFFYAAESIRLARHHRAVLPRDPHWVSLDPRVHLDHVARCSRSELMASLVEKYRRVFRRIGATVGESECASVYADTAAALDRFGVASGADDLANSARPHDQDWSVGVSPAHLVAETEAKLRRLFGITDPSTDPSGTELLRRWFTSESVLLAEQGGYSNPARSITDPGFHLAWARRTRFVAIVRDLMDKQREQFDRQLDTGAQAWHAFCAETMSRLAAWGGALVIAPGIPAEPAAWDATCQQLAADGGPERVWKHLDHVGRTVASNLLLRARSAQSPRPS
jgi:hypothetical protein